MLLTLRFQCNLQLFMCCFVLRFSMGLHLGCILKYAVTEGKIKARCFRCNTPAFRRVCSCITEVG